MSIRVKIDSIPYEKREKMSVDLQLKMDASKYSSFGKAQFFDAYEVDGDEIAIPFAYAVCVLGIVKPKTENYTKFDLKFTGSLREPQKIVKDEAISNLNKHGAALISCYPGFGKTLTSIYIASRVRLRTIVIVNKVPLMEQWVEAIENLCPDAKVDIAKPTSGFPSDCDFVIMNAINVSKFPKSSFNSYGTLIVDESHLIMSKVLSQCMFRIHPKYVIGLSATPYRPDGLNKLMDLFFTEHKIVRKLICPHIVYKVNTGFTPTMELNASGKVDWGKVLESQCINDSRNNMIVDIIMRHPDRNFIVISKRTEQSRYIHDRLKDMGESVTILVGSGSAYDKDARILVGNIQKVGVGFNHPKLNAMILASDVEEYFIQYLGRTMRVDERDPNFIKPIVFDLLDNNGILKKHFATRRSTYLEVGGEIKEYKIDF
jgi:superfamily II DNA or RNA helicase